MRHLLCLFLLAGFTVSGMGAEPGRAGVSEPEARRPSARIQVAVKSLTPSQRTRLLDLINHGSEEALLTLPRVGETRAAALKKARPILDLLDLLKVPGIGEQTVIDFVNHARARFPARTT